jgi:hypothetical protein
MNIKISKKKGAGGSLAKGAGGTVEVRDYEDLLLNFISKVTLSGADYSNGVYTRNSGGTTTFNGPDGKTIVWNGIDRWAAYDPNYDEGIAATFTSFDFITWFQADAPGNSPTGVIENSLRFVFDPAFYNSQITNGSVTLSLTGAIQTTYVNGIYVQQLYTSSNRAYYVNITSLDIFMFYEDEAWIIYDAQEREGYSNVFTRAAPGGTSSSSPAELDWSDAYNPDGYIPPVVSTQEVIVAIVDRAAKLDPFYLSQIRSYQINNNVVPIGPDSVRSYQKIINSEFNTKKAVIKNNTLSYIKYNDNSDVEPRKYNKNYQSINATQNIIGQNPPTDNRKPLLVLTKNDNSNIFKYGQSSDINRSCTFNLFIKLQRPVSHKNPNDINRIVREKKGIFLTAGVINGNKLFSIGYRSPYYNINGNLSYKLQFEPFSFVFSLGQCFRSEPANFVVMTDYKYKFNTMYMLTMTHDEAGYVRIYINGELQTTAVLNFDPLVQPNRSISAGGGRYASRRKMSDKLNQMPLAPGFIMKNGSTYGSTGTSHTCFQSGPTRLSADINYITLGKSNIGGVTRFNEPGSKSEKKRKRYLNNLDIGVINTYNVALSQSDLQEIYNNFRYKYI